MSTNLLIGYADIPFVSTAQTVSHSYSTTQPYSNLVTGGRSKYAELAATITGCNWIQFTTSSVQANYLGLCRANLLKQSGVTSVKVNRSAYPWNYPTSISNCKLWLDATRGVVADSTNRISSWTDLVSGIIFSQSTDANKPIWSRADNQANWIEFSQAFSGAYWTTSRATVADNQIANPLSTAVTAATLTATATTGAHQIAITSGSRPYISKTISHRVSVYLKYNNYQYVWFGVDDATDNGAMIDIQNGTINSTTGLTASAITSIGSGWYRVELTFAQTIAISATVTIAFGTAAAASGGVPSWTGAGTEKIHFADAQLHEASADSTYLATTNAVEVSGVNGLPAIKFLPNTYLTIATLLPASLSITGDISILAVFKRIGNDGTSKQYIFQCENGSTSGYGFRLDNASSPTWQPQFETANGSLSSLNGTSASSSNSVDYLTLQRATGTATHYLNGSANGSGAVANPAASTGNFATISNPTSVLQGYLCELLIYDKSLSGTERGNDEGYLNAKWNSGEYTKHQLDSTTLLGPHLEDWMETFTTNSAAVYWIVNFYSRSSTKRPLGKLYLGMTHDMGRDAVYPYTVRRDVQGIDNWDAVYKLSLQWKGITDSVRNTFITNVLKNKDISPVLLYAATYDAHLDNQTLIHAWIKSATIENAVENVNSLNLEFEEAI